MPNKNRAAIFQSFDSLKGLKELLAQQEKIIVKPKILDEDARDELDRQIHLIQPGMIVCITYYDGQHYIQKEGMVSKLDLNEKYMQIVKQKIPMIAIIEIEGAGLERPL